MSKSPQSFFIFCAPGMAWSVLEQLHAISSTCTGEACGDGIFLASDTEKGDDDIWLFINGVLAIDIGGIHTPVEVSATLDSDHADTYNIVSDGIYVIAIFQAERQTTSSTIKLLHNGFESPRSVCTPN